jgi:2,3-bisphosphoglycerate-dependent phosphoglycerate mutase
MVVSVEIPTGNPLLIELDDSGEKVLSARYLDTERAKPLPAIA